MTGGFNEEALRKFQSLVVSATGADYDFTECVDIFEFRLCQRDNGSYYGTAGKCRIGTETERDDLIKEIKTLRKITPAQSKKLDSLSDEELGRVHRAVKEQGLDIDSGSRVHAAVEALIKGNPKGAQKAAGGDLQEPDQAAKYADFYGSGKDKTYKAPHSTSPEEVKAVLSELKDSMEPKEFTSLMSGFASKGSPTKEQFQQAGWKDKKERGEAVLKSLMDNEFKDATGNFLSWRTGMQLDHRRAGAVGGGDKPDNWIWVSTATNQTKGAIERQVKDGLASGKIKPQDADKVINGMLIKKLRENAAMSPQQVADIKTAGTAKAAEKNEKALAYRDNLPLMPRTDRISKVDSAKGEDLKLLMQGSTRSVDKAGEPRGYRLVPTGGEGLRTRSDYPSASQMKSVLRMRWGGDLSTGDLKNIAGIVNGSSGSSRPSRELLDDILRKYGPEKPLSPKQVGEIESFITR